MKTNKSQFRIVEIGEAEFRFTHWFLPVVLEYRGHEHKHEIPCTFKVDCLKYKVGQIIEI